MGDVLKTRSGEVVRDIGSWERSWLDKHPLPPPVKDSERRVNTQGRRRQTAKDNPMLYITEPKVGGRFVVSVKHLGFSSKTFIFSEYGGRDSALKEATSYRDDMLIKRDAKLNG